jgi:restriction system protein
LLAATSNSQEQQVEVLLRALADLWPLWVIAAAVLIGKVAVELYRRRRLSRSGIHQIDRMDGRTFEQYLRLAFTRHRYAVELTRYRGDYGADLVISRDGHRTAVQAKRYAKKVGVKAIQEVVASKPEYGCQRAIVVTNNYFTPQARHLADKNQVELWDRDRLVSELLAAKDVRSDAGKGPDVEPTLESAPHETPIANLNGTVAAPTAEAGAFCVSCGAAVSEKVRTYCLGRPKRFHGLIYCYSHQREVGPAASASAD